MRKSTLDLLQHLRVGKQERTLSFTLKGEDIDTWLALEGAAKDGGLDSDAVLKLLLHEWGGPALKCLEEHATATKAAAAAKEVVPPVVSPNGGAAVAGVEPGAKLRPKPKPEPDPESGLGSGL